MITGHIPLDATGQAFWLGGVIVAAWAEAPQRGPHAALVLEVDAGDVLVRVFVPPGVWPAPRELLAPGRVVGIYGKYDTFPLAHRSRQVATEVHLQGTYH